MLRSQRIGSRYDAQNHPECGLLIADERNEKIQLANNRLVRGASTSSADRNPSTNRCRVGSWERFEKRRAPCNAARNSGEAGIVDCRRTAERPGDRRLLRLSSLKRPVFAYGLENRDNLRATSTRS